MVRPVSLLFPVLLAAPLALSGAPIAWNAATNTTGKVQLLDGNPVYAVSGGPGATITNGGAGGLRTYVFTGASYQDFLFTPPPGLRTTADISGGAPGTGDPDFDNITKSFTDANAGVTSGTQTIGGLTAGTQYRIQVFFNDQRACCSGRIMTYGDGIGNTVDLAAAGSGWGQFAIGTFTADGPTQALTHTANGFGNVHVNAILVTQPGPAPDPDPPAKLSVTPGNDRNILNWDDNLQPGFLEFRVRRSTSEGGPYTTIATTAASGWIDLTAANGVTYYYVITAVNIDQVESPPSDEAQGTPSPSATPPNFLFIITDDQDTYSLGAYRRSEPAELDAANRPYLGDTPSMDRLAAEGMLFHNAHHMGALGGAVCTFSRTMIMTGRHLWHRQVSNGNSTFPGAFNRGGYDTYRTCKSGNSYERANSEFDLRNDATKRGNTDGNGSEWHADNVITYLDNRAASGDPDPFLIYLGFSHPHDERNARTNPNLAGRYRCLNTTQPDLLTNLPGRPPLPRNHLPADQRLGIPANYPFHPFDHGHLEVRDEVNVPGILRYRTEAVVRNEIGRNFACVDWIDRQLGRVLAKLEEHGLMDNTYIVFTSDHGIAIGRHGLQGKQNLYEHTWRVPFIVRGPGIAAGSESDALVYLHDVFPTFCDLAGATVPTPATIGANDGMSLRPILEGTTERIRDAVYGVYRGGSQPGMRSVKNGRWKLIKYDVDDDNVQETQLFDLVENPFELLPAHGVPNLAHAPSHALLRQELEELLMAERRRFDDPDPFLGDRTVLRFEDGNAGESAGMLADRLPWRNDGTAASGNASAPPRFSSDVPSATEFVFGEPNRLSLDFERDNRHYVQIPHHRTLSFGPAPFTIEAWVKLESLPTGNDLASRQPLVMKKVPGSGDLALDFLFLAAAGTYGGSSDYDKLALHLGSAVVLSALSIPDTDWHHLSVAFDPVGNRVRFTLDQQVDVRATTAAGTANIGPLLIGAHTNSSGVFDSSFDGLIDELSITNGFLPLAELQPLRNTPLPGPFRITTLAARDDGTLDLTFESNPSFLYDLEHSPSLEDGSWTKVRTFLGGSPGSTRTTLTGIGNPGLPHSFYRVVCYGPSRSR